MLRAGPGTPRGRTIALVANPTPLRPRTRARPAKPPPARREPLSTRNGRAWINGAEVGGTDPRFAHLNRSYD
jgi:hypothetical protein